MWYVFFTFCDFSRWYEVLPAISQFHFTVINWTIFAKIMNSPRTHSFFYMYIAHVDIEINVFQRWSHTSHPKTSLIFSKTCCSPPVHSARSPSRCIPATFPVAMRHCFQAVSISMNNQPQLHDTSSPRSRTRWETEEGETQFGLLVSPPSHWNNGFKWKWTLCYRVYRH